MQKSDFESQREEALVTLDNEEVDNFILIADNGQQTKTVFGAKEDKKHPPDYLGMLQQAIGLLFQMK